MKNELLKRKVNIAKPRAMRHPRHRGQALIETAFVVTILIFLTMGLIQFALIANARATLSNLSREGARYAAVHATETGSDVLIKNYIVKVADSTPLSSIVASDVTISPAEANPMPTARASSNPITVTVSYNLRSKFILPLTFPGLSKFGTATTSTAIMIIE